ncbi:MAG TPA: helix-turn-helix domain-containing protein [Patescibacteria group bacterium]|nr:helix-turn-helix domain-containing protein [Patescibacteria group bacterium]
MNDIILKLEQLGFSSYEAKAYYALIRKYPANGYEISKIGKIPSAKIYDTLNRLKMKGAIVESSTETGKYYPVPSEKLLARLNQEFTSMIQDLGSQLKQAEPLPDIELSLNFSGYEYFLEKALKMINGAKTSLLMSLWPSETVLLADAAMKAQNRGIAVIAGVFGNCSLDDSYCVNLEHCGTSSQKRLGKRLNVIVGDSTEVLICEADENGDSEGVWTTTASIVLIAKEYIKHDIWGHALIDALGEENFRTMCKESPLLTQLINNR